jgi:phosphoribosylamine--glycine ligase
MGSEITLPATENSNTKIFHAGTKLDQNSLVTNGGRVLCVTALGRDLTDAQQSAYQTIQNIEFDGMYFRKDIGNKAL